MQIQGFIVLDGMPVRMELSEDITAGTAIGQIVPVFDDIEDAKQAFLNNTMRFSDRAEAVIIPVVLTIGEPVAKVELTPEDEEDDE